MKNKEESLKKVLHNQCHHKNAQRKAEKAADNDRSFLYGKSAANKIAEYTCNSHGNGERPVD